MKKILYMVICIISCSISYSKKMSVDLTKPSKLGVEITDRYDITSRIEKDLSINKKIENDLKESRHDKVVERAITYIGVKYVWGGNSRKGVDCSGFVKNVYNSVGVYLPRSSREQAMIGESIDPKNVKRGDLLYFTTKKNSPNTISHVGIYVGNKYMIHASSKHGKVEKLNLQESGLLKKLKVIKRII